MQKNKTVTINGRLYDAVTGLPVTISESSVTPSSPKPIKTISTAKAAATTAGRAPQRSQTLNRRVVKKTAPAATKPQARKAGATMDISRSNRISKFAAHPVAKPAAQPTAVTPDRPATQHPLAARAAARQLAKQQKKSAPVKSSKQIKDEEIAKAIAAPTSKETKAPKSKSFLSRHGRKLIIVIVCLVVLAVGGYLSLINMPAVSVGFAASQAGIKATYPEYQPDGYSLSQPVTYASGEVTLNFVSNSGGGGYTIKETRSSWDSSAVLEKIVKEQAGENYLTTQDSGLTIYTYDGNAAWVNAGILYTITATAPLSNEQVRNIATSL